MPELLGFGMFWWALGAYLLLVVVSQVAWWSRRDYFPNKDLCSEAHDRFHLSQKEKEDLKNDPKALAAAKERFWHVIGMRLIAQVPEELSIEGFFCTVAWPIVILLNIVILAQVVGTLFGDGGGVWEIYPLGTYGAIALFVATFYAIGQTVLGIMYGHWEDKKRYLVLVILSLAVLVEGGLAVYRAWLIRGGATVVAPNAVDSSLASQLGLVAGAFFGVFFPVVHASLGYVAFPKFVVPIIRYAIRLSGGFLMLVWSAANYALLAWHPAHPRDWEKVPKEEKAHWDEQRRLFSNATTLAGDLKLLLDELPAAPATAEQTLKDARTLLDRWEKLAKDANEELDEASKLTGPSLPASMDGSESPTPRISRLYQLANSHDRLATAIRSIRSAEIELDQDAVTEGKRLVLLMESCRTDLVKLQRRLEAIQAIAHLGSDAEGLLKGCETSLTNLQNAFRTIPEPKPGHFRFPDFTLLKDKIAQCEAAYGRLEARWGSAKPVIPPEAELKARRDEMDAMANLTGAYSEASKSLYEAKQMATERLRRVDGRPRWFYWLADRIA
jgi:hypothetical protein